MKQRKGYRMNCDVGKAAEGLRMSRDIGEAMYGLENAPSRTSPGEPPMHIYIYICIKQSVVD